MQDARRVRHPQHPTARGHAFILPVEHLPREADATDDRPRRIRERIKRPEARVKAEVAQHRAEVRREAVEPPDFHGTPVAESAVLGDPMPREHGLLSGHSASLPSAGASASKRRSRSALHADQSNSTPVQLAAPATSAWALAMASDGLSLAALAATHACGGSSLMARAVENATSPASHPVSSNAPTQEVPRMLRPRRPIPPRAPLQASPHHASTRASWR